MSIATPIARPLLVFGHRGAAGHAPENTLASMRWALEAGVDGIEFDVRQLGQALIVLHDDDLARTTSGSGHYKAMRLADLRALDAGGGERVPLLEEVLALAAGHVDINVEVKEAGIADAVIDALAATQPALAPERVLLSSFDAATTARLAARRGGMRLGLLYEGDFDAALARAVTLGAWSMHLPFKALDAARIAAVHAAGLRALVYTVNTPSDIARCHAAGVDGVFSDFPDRVIAFNRALGAAERAP